MAARQVNRNKEGGDIMAYDIAMDVNTNDIVLKNGDVLLIDNAERIAQQILISLRFWLGEWFLDTRQGVPYLEYILVKNPNEAHIKQVLTDAIKDVDGVDLVTNMDLSLNRIKRALTVEYTVKTSAGLLTRTEVLGYG